MDTNTISKQDTKTVWNIDPSHSEVHFKVRHLMISTVTGAFTKFSGTMTSEQEDFSDAKIQFRADASGITTGDIQRDGHLASADFFEVENHPEIIFESTSFRKTENGVYELAGNLEMRGVSKPVVLEVEYNGTGRDPWGNIKAGFMIHGKINRKDWGINWNATLETGGFLVSDEVKILCEVQLNKQN